MSESKGTVLVVDDEEPVRQVAEAILSSLGYSALTSASGEEAVARLQEGTRPDVVLLDLIMPGMDGFQTLRRLHEIEPSLPILICSGYADRAGAESLVREGAAGFVNKPYHMERLDQQIQKAIASSRPGTDHAA